MQKKISYLLFFLFSPFLVSGQIPDFFSDLKLIKDFRTYHHEFTINTEKVGDPKEYQGKKQIFDETIRLLSKNEESITDLYIDYLLDKESNKLDSIIGTRDDLSHFKEKLLEWKLDQSLFYKQRKLMDFFDKLSLLIKESETIINSSGDAFALIVFSSRLEEVELLIQELM